MAEDQPRGAFIVLIHQRADQRLYRLRRFRHRHEQQLKLSVVKGDLLRRDLHQSRDRGRVAYRAEQIFPADRLPVRRDRHAVGTQRLKILDAFEHVCKVTEHVLDILRHGIGGARKRAERCDINKIPAAEHTDVQIPLFHAHGSLRRHREIGGDIQACGKVIRAAARQIAHQRAPLLRQAHQTVDRFIQRAVAAVADNKIKLRPKLGGKARGVAAALRLLNADQIPRLRVDGHRIKQGRARLCFSGAGIDNEKQLLFHALILLSSRFFAVGACRSRRVCVFL